MSQYRKPPKVCTYCGDDVGSTNDHVVAKSLLQVDHRQQNIWVPSCCKCNNQKARLEDYISAVFLMSMDVPQAIRYSAVRRLSVNSKYIRSISQSSEPLQVTLDDGSVVPGRSFHIDNRAISDLYRFIATGLYRHHTAKIIDWYSLLAVATDYIDGDEEHLERAFLNSDFPKFHGSLGHGSFEYTGTVTDDKLGLSIWKMRLYRVTTYDRREGPLYPWTYIEFIPRTISRHLPSMVHPRQTLFGHPRQLLYKPLDPSSLVWTPLREISKRKDD